MPTSHPIQCPSCGFQVQAADMNLETLSARCRVCNSFIDLRPETPQAGRSTEPLPVPLPGQITVSSAGGGMVIERRWFSATAIFLVIFCALWFGFLAVWYALAWGTGNLIVLLFPLIHVTAGLILLYSTIAMMVNRTWITVAGGRLTVRHGPMPWPGKRDLPTSTLEQLYCQEHVSRSKNGTSITYSVRVRRTDGKLEKLVEGLPERDQALYIEQRVEQHLGIVNHPVADELRR